MGGGGASRGRAPARAPISLLLLAQAGAERKSVQEWNRVLSRWFQNRRAPTQNAPRGAIQGPAAKGGPGATPSRLSGAKPRSAGWRARLGNVSRLGGRGAAGR